MVNNGKLVCFRASFRQDGSRGGLESPNITHAVLDGEVRTLCGRAGWETDEGPLVRTLWDDGEVHLWVPDCLRCAARLARLRVAQ